MSWISDTFDLSDRIALVNGVRGQYGVTIAALLAACGARVLAVGSSSLKAECDGSVYSFLADDEEGSQDSAVQQGASRIDLLINVARLRETTRWDVESLWDVYDDAIIYFYRSIHEALPLLRTAKGSVVNILVEGSPLELRTDPVHRAAVENASVGLIKALASELGPEQIRVNGIVQMGILCDCMAPVDVARVALFLGSPAASAMTGVTIRVDTSSVLDYRPHSQTP